LRDEDDARQPITIFTSSDPGLLAVAQSLLQDADIEFFVAGAATASLYPGIFNPFAGPEIRVAAEDAEDARQLLKDLG
jgi:Putative prokaryotic signal transducing protein